MQFSTFSQYLEQLENTPSRLEMTELLAKVYAELETEELVPASYLMCGKLVPKYQSLEFSLSTKMIIRILSRLMFEYDNSLDNESLNLFNKVDETAITTKVWKIYKELGDLGATTVRVFETIKLNVKSAKSIDLNAIFQILKDIALDGGTGSQERKLLATVDLLKQVDRISAKFIVRIIMGRLRLGFSTMTMIDALSWAMSGDKSLSKKLEGAYQKRADIGLLAKDVLSLKDVSKLDEYLKSVSIEIGIPTGLALCQRLNSSQEILEKMEVVLAEPKYDGLRVQLHFDKKTNNGQKKYWAFTRNLDNVTHMFPELERIVSSLNCQECVIDSEAICINQETGEFLTFQETIKRKRKHGVDEMALKMPISFFVFDIMSIDGKSLLDTPLEKRKEILANLFENNSVIKRVSYIKTTDAKELKEYHEEQLKKGLEGAVMKKIDSLYRSGRKGWRWVKIKEEEGMSGKLKDTLDLVVMGYYSGRGKRSEFGIGALLVGILKDEKILTVAKIGTGLSDEMLKDIKKKCDAFKVSKKPSNYEVHKNLKPDAWIEPNIVLEIAADEITKSPTHSAGFALRFPRLLRIRTDKNWDQATTLEEMEKIKGN